MYNNFIERSLKGAISFLKESVFADEYAAKDGLLQSIDPRMKAVMFLVLIIAAICTRSISAVLLLYAACLIMAFYSRIDMAFFLKRTWIFIPLFSLFIAIPALFSVFTPGEALINMNFAGLHLVITRQGFDGASLFVARVITSVSLAVLLSLTTRHFALLKVLGIFKIPNIFIMTLGMCYRYIYLFLEIVENTYLAIKSRVGTRLRYRKGRRIAAWSISGLWQRSYYMNQAVYDAMLSRGFAGDPVVLDHFRTRFKDWALLSASVIFLAVLLYLGGKLQ